MSNADNSLQQQIREAMQQSFENGFHSGKLRSQRIISEVLSEAGVDLKVTLSLLNRIDKETSAKT